MVFPFQLEGECPFTRRICTRFAQVTTLPEVPRTTFLIINQIILSANFHKIPFWILPLLIPTPLLDGINLISLFVVTGLFLSFICTLFSLLFNLLTIKALRLSNSLVVCVPNYSLGYPKYPSVSGAGVLDHNSLTSQEINVSKG